MQNMADRTSAIEIFQPVLLEEEILNLYHKYLINIFILDF